MTKKQESDLMNQIVALYEAWSAQLIDTERYALLTNGLFNIAKRIDEKRMSEAFMKGANFLLERLRDTKSSDK